ncbi:MULTISPECIES: NrfD/PsrC family molybdoenzyme membrane anchor subunit [Sphingobacterium]|jgi:Ni/Fe-hydrogenase subunit HybB-like protein|uniref:NrfD/PsrC family molybdoenzyme membrane anchor subunit n=2 Tax=Sphingobacterium TaxID=28453 RepID=A0ABW5YT17_9SPHI|nr:MULTISPECIES: NrfD/PsrC family molybdoenzyme membrane anchor subunit [Sphingobacterium]KKX47584.1 Fe-S-cluster-containing hydrogenase [Sphingobacterium sp. IITKGP-BTPF85]MBB2952857.1 molybdopterin-containing oxidoreductase family membrane subunit [Sphingobacterium sp. JUb56]MCS3555472.1 molybdopterin-containing oxidoreductase family membrane subunit [Sphingobacterium sp. JUb21]MCW2261320.1 molybdopterin-containing oxidoreductase family membrane subunit [Sphingobacterium kitahiroshimense]NJI
MSSHNESILREPLMTGKDITYAKITDDILLPVENKPNKAWWIGFTVAVLGALLWVVSVSYTFWTGIGAWGLNKTVGWAWDITDFVWWVGIGHAGTLISAVLLIFRQNWRNSINRSAEAMTIFAVICAATYVVAHMGRPWLAYWIFPLPNQFGSLWVNFNSPLVWDAFAISTYFTVSLVFWYCGLLPDIATIRDRATGLRQKIYSVLSFGWNGSVKTWQRFEIVSIILAGISTPLVLSVHTIVSFDFATSVIPGWHTTIFPPYFVAGAIFSGFAMVQTLLLILRKVMNFENYITMFHIEAMNKIIMTTGSIVGIAYLTELFIAMYSQSEYEMYAFQNRMFGPYAWAYWSMMTCNVISPQLFWFKKIRTSIPISWILSIVVNIGMWFERFVIIVTSLHRDYLPSSWAMFYPTWTDVGIFVGSIGLFFTLFLLFLRFLPGIAIAEVKLLLKSSSLQQKTKLVKEGAFPAEQVEYFRDSLGKYDSVTEQEIKELK